RHEREVTLAQGNAVHWTWHQVQQALVVVDAAHDPSHAANGRKRRVIRVHGQLDVRLFRHGDHAPQEVLEVVPQGFLRDRTKLRRRRIAQQLRIEAGDDRTAARLRV